MEYGFRLMQPNWMEFRNTFALYREKYAREFSVSRKNDRRDGGSLVVVVIVFFFLFKGVPFRTEFIPFDTGTLQTPLRI